MDYSKYFSGVAGSSSPGGPGVTTHAVEDTSGFVQPLDFTGLFVGGHFGLDGLAGGASQQVFQTPGSVSVALPPLSSGSFPLHHAQVPSNTSGFVSNNVNFRSLFDTSGSSSENGFRPQDFLPKESQPQSTTHGRFFSPAFSTLQRDVDREVNYQKKEEAVIEQSKAASRRQPVEDDEEEDDFDPSEYEFDDTPILDPNDRSPQKYLKQPYEEEEDYGNPNRKHTDRKTPHSSQKIVYYPSYEARPAESKHKKPLPALPDPEEDDDYHSYDYKERDDNGGKSPPRQRPPPVKVLYPKYPSKNIPSKPIYESSSHVPHKPRPHAPPYQPSYPGSNQYSTPYNSAQTKNFPVSSGPRSAYTNPHPRNGPVEFRPSPRDPYIIPSNRRSEYPQNRPQAYDGPYPLPQTEFAAVIPRKPKQPVASASENKKSCKKINKKIDPNDFARFKREQMTCYVCTNKEKGNTYEECSYESEPKANSYYKGSAEAYSSDTVLTPKTFHVRERRNVKYSLNENDNNSGSLNSKLRYKSLIRKVRQYDYSSDPDEKGHGPENYRFGPEYFKNNKQKKQNKRSQRRYDDESDYDEDGGEEEEEDEDIEKEYQPPGASDNDDCERVDKNGLSCMVCVNPKTGGSYEQCSYASEPEANRYEYARESRYGSKKPNNERYKRYTENMYQRKDVEKTRRPKQNQIHHQKKRGEKHRDNVHFKDNKLKRKKVARGGYNKKPLAFSGSESKRTKVKKVHDEEEEMPGVVGLDPYFYGSPEQYNPNHYDERGRKIKKHNKNQSEDDETSATSAEEEIEDFNPSYEETFFRLFPELEGTDPYTGEKEGENTEEKEANEEDDNYPVIPYEEVNDEEESESKQQNNKVKPGFNYGIPVSGYYFDDDESKKDLEKTLDEFIQKNRSECKKVVKNHMTCYQCLDKKGMQHEECMFVAASEPKSKHLAYHEVKEFRVVPKENANKSDSNINSTHIKQDNQLTKHPVVEEQETTRLNSPPYEIYESKTQSDSNESPRGEIKTSKRNRKKKAKSDRGVATEASLMVVPDNEGQPALTYDIKKITPKTFETLPTISNTDVSGSSKILQRKKRKPEDQPTADTTQDNKPEEAENDGEERDQKEEPPNTRPNYNSIPPDPEGFDEREGPEGAYSHETEPVFDSVLKITLPKYMLMKSEHEAIFDEVFRSG